MTLPEGDQTYDESEIKVTEEMQLAGAEVVWSFIFHEAPGPIAMVMAKDVFLEMYRVHLNSLISTT